MLGLVPKMVGWSPPASLVVKSAPSPALTRRLPSVANLSVPMVCEGETTSGAFFHHVPIRISRDDGITVLESVKFTV